VQTEEGAGEELLLELDQEQRLSESPHVGGPEEAPTEDEASAAPNANFETYADAVADHYGLSVQALHDVIREERGSDSEETIVLLESSAVGWVAWEAVSEEVLEKLRRQIREASSPDGEEVAMRIMREGGADLAGCLRSRMRRSQFEPFDEASRDQAIAHGLVTLADLKATNDAYLAAGRSVVLEKIERGEFDVWPITNLRTLMKHSSMEQGRRYGGHASVRGWSATVSCRPGESSLVENALLVRDAAFDQWWAEVASIAGIQGY
jgi:hypothetical protein